MRVYKYNITQKNISLYKSKYVHILHNNNIILLYYGNA